MQSQLKDILPGEFLLLHVLQLFSIAQTGQSLELIVCFAKHVEHRNGAFLVVFATTVSKSSAKIAVQLGIPVIGLFQLLDFSSDF